MPLGVNISGLDERKLARAIGDAMPHVLERAAKDMRNELNQLAPTPRVNYQTRRVGTKEVDVFSTHPGAQAMSTGAFIRPRKGRVLRFRGDNGEWVYTRKPVRTKGTGYIARALRKRRQIVNRAVDAALKDI